MTQGLPPLPRVNLDKVDLGVQRIIDVLAPYSGAGLDAKAVRRLGMDLYAAHPAAGIRRHAVQDTLAQYEGRVLTLGMIDVLARQLVGRANELKTGPVVPFERHTVPEWVPVEIQRVHGCSWRSGKPAQELDLYALHGRAAGHTTSKKFPEGWLAWLAYKIGFSTRLAYDFNPEHFLGLRFWAFFDADEQGDIELQDWGINAALRKRNQQLIYRRSRFDLDADRVKYTCPFDLDCYCFECHKTIVECNASPRRKLGYVESAVRSAQDRQSGGSQGGRQDTGEAAGCAAGARDP